MSARLLRLERGNARAALSPSRLEVTGAVARARWRITTYFLERAEAVDGPEPLRTTCSERLRAMEARHRAAAWGDRAPADSRALRDRDNAAIGTHAPGPHRSARDDLEPRWRAIVEGLAVRGGAVEYARRTDVELLALLAAYAGQLAVSDRAATWVGERGTAAWMPAFVADANGGAAGPT